LWIAGILQMTTNLVFSWISLQGVDNSALALGIVVDNVASGIATVIFIAYLSTLCANPLHTATQFALLTALASTGRTVLSASAGWSADTFGWFWFFGVSALVGLPCAGAAGLAAGARSFPRHRDRKGARQRSRRRQTGRRALIAAASVPSSR
jgi:MFS family permease